MADKSFLSDILQRIARAGPFLSGKSGPDSNDIMAQCEELFSDRGEASGLKTALRVLDLYEASSWDEKCAFFKSVTGQFGVDEDVLEAAVSKWTPGDSAAARQLHVASEPRSQELIRRLNRVPGATARLVAMRADLLAFRRENPEVDWLNRDFQHLFSSWFNRGFLEIEQIDWSTPASILEKIIEYEAVHQITGWDDLRQRVGAADRRLFAFFHPAMPADPLIFVEVALTRTIPGAIGPILQKDREVLDPREATAAVFYSISNCQKGLRGISFGNFLIKQVVAELQRELPTLKTFVTLSPVPGLRSWTSKALAEEDPLLASDDRDALTALQDGDTPTPELARRLAARYLLTVTRKGGTAFDSVAHFHLGNGAILHKVHADADMSDRGISNSWGVMVNYLYDEGKIEEHHQAYATNRTIASSAEVRSLAGGRKRPPAIAAV